MIRTDTLQRPSPLVWPVLAVVALALGGVHLWFSVLLPDAARFSFDSAEYALAGRAWLETGRLVTPFVHPAALGASPGPPYPLIVGHPLVPALDALSFALLGRDSSVTLLPALLAYLAAVLATARLAWSLTRSDAVALASGLLFAASPWALRFSSEGLSEMPFTACFTAAIWLLAELPERPRPVLLGVLLGLAHLARPVLVPLLPVLVPAILLLTPRASRIPTLLRVVAGFAPLASITLIYQAVASGHPFQSVGNYLLLANTSPDLAVSRLNRMTPPPDGIAWVLAHPELYAAKLTHGIRSLSYAAWVQGGRWPGLLALIAVLHALWRPEPRGRLFALTLAALAGVLTLLSAATVADPRMLFPLLPAGIALAMSEVAWLARLVGRGRPVAVAAACAMMLCVGAVALARDWEHRVRHRAQEVYLEREWAGIGNGVNAMLPPDGLLASDAAPWIAWFTGHPVTLIPLTPEALIDGPERLRPAAVVLTNEWLIGRPGEEPWQALFDSREAPAGFAFAGHVRSGRLQAVVFVRQPDRRP